MLFCLLLRTQTVCDKLLLICFESLGIAVISATGVKSSDARKNSEFNPTGWHLNIVRRVRSRNVQHAAKIMPCSELSSRLKGNCGIAMLKVARNKLALKRGIEACLEFKANLSDHSDRELDHTNQILSSGVLVLF